MSFSLLSAVKGLVLRFQTIQFTVESTIDLPLQDEVVFSSLSEMGHEQVMFCSDPETGLKAIIAIHNTQLGPSLGGLRMWQYVSDLDALTDALRLSRGMSFKASISGLNLGGGKAVIIGNSRTQKSEILMRRFGRFVHNLNGKYITAEDVGTSTQDMTYIRMETPHVTGIPEISGGSGDPSPVTAYGTLLGIKASLKKLTGNESLSGKKVLVQGTGNVGSHLIEMLVKENASVLVSDIYEEKLKEISNKFPVQVVDTETVYDQDCDIYAPCALGATLNPDTLTRLKCSIIAGAANNQLRHEKTDALIIRRRGILYAPDFVINAGGLINVYTELNGYNKDKAYAQAEGIYTTTLKIFEEAEKRNLTTSETAIQLATERIAQIGRLKSYL